MKEYIAIYENTKSSVSLTRDTQMDKHLSRGAKIYCLDGEEMELVASPEKGYIGERPVFPVRQTMSLWIRPERILEKSEE